MASRLPYFEWIFLALRHHRDRFSFRGGLWHQLPYFFERFDVQFNCFLHQPFRLFERITCGDTTQQVRRIGRVILVSPLVDHDILFHRSFSLRHFNTSRTFERALASLCGSPFIPVFPLPSATPRRSALPSLPPWPSPQRVRLPRSVISPVRTFLAGRECVSDFFPLHGDQGLVLASDIAGADMDALYCAVPLCPQLIFHLH
jgi:hypothetical protein